MGVAALGLRGVTFEPAPWWAEAKSFEPSGPLPPEFDVGGLRFWLLDDFADLLGRERVLFGRQVREIVNPDGVQRSASFEIDFDPSYQRLVVHHLRVQRGGQVRDLAREENFEVLRRERDLERAHYDGRLTAHAIIPDLRVGDIIDWAFSVVGDHPVTGGAFAVYPDFQWGQPVARTRYRVFARAGRNLSVHYWGRRPEYAKSPLNNGNVLHCWTADRFPAVAPDPGAPPWWIDQSRVQVSDAMSWSQVSDLYRPGYASSGALPAELEVKVADLRAAEPSEAGKIAAALKLVQREVRYLAISMGEGGLVPRRVEEIWSTRFGDCKDKSRLLTAILNRLGVDAAPALVHTDLGRTLKEAPPTVAAFNHCIVRVRSAGRTYWLDATHPVQGGRLDRLEQPRMGWALPLVPSSDLEDMGEGEPPTMLEQHERIVFGARRASPAELHIESTHRAAAADGLRRQLANEGLAGLSKSYLDYYRNHYGALDVAGPMAVEDREPDNEIRLTESYLIKEPWRLSDDGRQAYFRTVDEILHRNLPLYPPSERTSPLYLGSPRRAVQSVQLDLPRRWAVETRNDGWELAGIKVGSQVELTQGGRHLLLKTSVEVTDRTLRADLEPTYSRNAERTLNGAQLVLSHTLRNGEFVSGKGAKGGRPFLGLGASGWFHVIWLLGVASYFIAKIALSH